MAPKFNKTTQIWDAISEADNKGACGSVGRSTRQGPVPFFKHITDFDLYDQMVLKYNKWPMINVGGRKRRVVWMCN